MRIDHNRMAYILCAIVLVISILLIIFFSEDDSNRNLAKELLDKKIELYIEKSKEIKKMEKIKEKCVVWVLNNSSVILEDEAKDVVDIVFNQCNKPFLMLALICVESNFNPKALSKAGAIGLSQIMPMNFQELQDSLNNYCVLKSERSLFNMEVNIRCGNYLLNKFIDQNSGDVEKGLKQYFGADSKAYVDKIKDAMFSLLMSIDVGSTLLKSERS